MNQIPLLALMMSAVMASPAQAQSFDLNSHLQPDVRAGVYFRLPFGGEKTPRFGAAMTFHNASNGQHLLMRPQPSVDLLNLQFTRQGFDSLSLMGQDMSGRKPSLFNAKEGGGAGLALVGAAIMVGALVVMTVEDPDKVACNLVDNQGAPCGN